MADSPVPGSARRWPTASIALTVAVPWLWFVVRRLGGTLDIVAVALPAVGLLASLGVLLGVVGRRRLPLLAALSLLAVCAVATAAPRLPRHGPAPAVPVRIAMANVYNGNPTPREAAEALLGRDVDVLVTVEVQSAAWRPLLGASALPYGVFDGELGVRSRYPVSLLAPGGLPRSRLIRVRVDAPRAPFVLYVTHGLNPFHDSSSFTDQRTFVQDIVRASAAEQRSVVVVGDFNMSDRSENYRLMDSAFLDAMREGSRPASTYFGGLWPILLMRIDHAFVSHDWCADEASTFDVPGSDHRGIQFTAGPCG